MKKTWVIWILRLLVAVNIAALATIGYHRFGRYGERQHEKRQTRQEFLHRELDLSDKQSEQMKKMKATLMLNIKPFRAELGAKREQLVQLLMAADPDHSRINSILREIDSLQSELQKQIIVHLLDEKKILTTDQQKKFFYIIRERLIEEESHHNRMNRFPAEIDN